MENTFVQACLTAYKDIIVVALPIVFVIGVSNLAINTVIDAFFHGKLHFGGRK